MTNTEALLQSKQAQAIACCIQRARSISPKNNDQGWPSSDNEIYWYTREKAVVVARELGIKWPWVLKQLSNISALTFMNELDPEFIQKSEIFWDELAHPDLIVGEIMES